MDNEKSKDLTEFITFLKSLNANQQAGLMMTIEGLQLLADKKSGRKTANHFRSQPL